jgi:uncharacterized protein
MIIDISKLKSGLEVEIEVNESINVSKDILDKAGILELKDTAVNGYIHSDELENYYLDLLVTGTMVLPCSVTLQPFDYAFESKIDGDYLEIMSEIESFGEKVKNCIDIFPIIWENILMEIPIKVTCPDATDLKLSGDGWKLVTEGEEENNASAFDKLKDLL